MLLALLLGACSATVGGSTDFGEGEPNAADAGVPEAAPDARPVDPEPQLEVLVLTQSTGVVNSSANMNCRYGAMGPNADTRHFRLFPAATIGGSTITEATLPIEVASSTTGTQPATLRLHRLTGDILAGEFTLLTEVAFDVPNQTLGEVRVPLNNIEVAPEDSIVLEVAMPDGAQERNLRFGFNLEAQTGPTYYASDACAHPLPVDLATLNNPALPGQTFAGRSWLVSLTAERLEGAGL